MENHLSYFSDDEESEWLANIDPNLLDNRTKKSSFMDTDITIWNVG